MKKKAPKYQLKKRYWLKEKGHYELTDNELRNDAVEEYSLYLMDENGKEVYENDIIRDEHGDSLIRYVKGAWVKYYRDGSIKTVNIFEEIKGVITSNKIRS